MLLRCQASKKILITLLLAFFFGAPLACDEEDPGDTEFRSNTHLYWDTNGPVDASGASLQCMTLELEARSTLTIWTEDELLIGPDGSNLQRILPQRGFITVTVPPKGELLLMGPGTAIPVAYCCNKYTCWCQEGPCPEGSGDAKQGHFKIKKQSEPK